MIASAFPCDLDALTELVVQIVDQYLGDYAKLPAFSPETDLDGDMERFFKWACTTGIDGVEIRTAILDRMAAWNPICGLLICRKLSYFIYYTLEKIVRGISYNNAARYFGIE